MLVPFKVLNAIRHLVTDVVFRRPRRRIRVQNWRFCFRASGYLSLRSSRKKKGSSASTVGAWRITDMMVSYHIPQIHLKMILKIVEALQCRSGQYALTLGGPIPNTDVVSYTSNTPQHGIANCSLKTN